MQPRIHPAIASQHYRMLEIKSRVESASAHGLVALLYEELLRALDLCIASATKRNAVSGGNPAAKALSIIIALESSLDLEKGGDLAVTLARIYRACSQSLNEAGRTGDTEKMSKIRDAISNIAYAWQALSKP